MSYGIHHTSLVELGHRLHDALDLRRGSDNPHAHRVSHEPVLAVREVHSAVQLLERPEAVLGGQEERRGVRAAFGHVDERALGVPAQQVRRRRRAVRPEEAEEGGIERPLLGL